jgi:uncharacterized membrane protein YphA (DoxX/SURF4 family)
VPGFSLLIGRERAMIRISFWTCAFLVVLRICIGWHFYFEGATKIKSAYQGKASGEKVFTSESYFRESEGPFGKLVKSRMADPDQEVIDRLMLQSVEGDASNVSPASRFPTALAKDWDDYFNRFVSQYRLDDELKTKAQSTFDQQKAKFVLWVQGYTYEPKDKKTGEAKRILLKVKRKAPGPNNSSADYEQEMTVAERAAELKKKSEEVRDAYIKMSQMGKDVDVLGLRTLKGDAAAIRTELKKELDDQTKAMKDSLAKLLDTRVSAYASQADSKDVPTTLQAMLTPMKGGSNPLATMWDDYAAYVKDFAPNITDAQKAGVDEALAGAKTRFDRWLGDEDMFTGSPLQNKEVGEWKKNYQTALARLGVARTGKEESAGALEKEDVDALTKQMQTELKGQSDAMRAQVGAPLLGEDRAKGYAAPSNEHWLWLFPKSWSLIDYIDWSTRWFLPVVGAFLMVGLFTRLSCFAAAGFLVLTVLSQPSFPWLPAPPTGEGSYLFVNKNVIELVALLALMTTRTGQWFGLDAIVSWFFKRRES